MSWKGFLLSEGGRRFAFPFSSFTASVNGRKASRWKRVALVGSLSLLTCSLSRGNTSIVRVGYIIASSFAAYAAGIIVIGSQTAVIRRHRNYTRISLIVNENTGISLRGMGEALRRWQLHRGTVLRQRAARRRRRALWLNGFRRGAGRRRGRPRGDVLVGFLWRAAVDFDRTFEVRAVFDHDLCRRQIPDHQTGLLDLDPSLGVHVPLHVTVHHHVAGVDVCRQLRRHSDDQLVLLKLD